MRSSSFCANWRRSSGHEMAAQVASSSERADVVARDAARRFVGAAWGQIQPGKTAIFWIPQLTPAADAKLPVELTQAVASALDAAGVEMTQTLLPQSVGADGGRARVSRLLAIWRSLLYLSGESSSTALNDSRESRGTEFVAVRRLAARPLGGAA